MEVKAEDKLRQTLIHNQNHGPKWQTGVTTMMLQWLLTGSRRSPCSSHKYTTEIHQSEIIWRWYFLLQYSTSSLRRRLNSLKFKQLRGMAAFSSLRFQYIIDLMDINLSDLILILFTKQKTPHHRQLPLDFYQWYKIHFQFHLCRSPIPCSMWDWVQNKNIFHPFLEAELVDGHQTVLFSTNVPPWAATSFLRWVSCMKYGLKKPFPRTRGSP